MKAEPQEAVPVKQELPVPDLAPCDQVVPSDPYYVVPTQHLRTFGPEL